MEEIYIKSTPLVSVIIPLYNAEKYVQEAIESILRQTYPNIEIVIVNDGSTDNSLNTVMKYESNSVKIFSNPNSGAAFTRNFGFSNSRGEYVKFFDADDILSSETIMEQVNALAHNQNSVASGCWGRFYRNDLRTFKLNPEECWADIAAEEWICKSWKNAQPMTQPGIFLIPRKIIEKAGLWDERLTLNDDTEFFTRIMLTAERVVFCKKAILYYRSGMEGRALSGQKSLKAAESYLLAINLSCDYLLHKLKTEQTQLYCANILRGFVYEYYCLYPKLVAIAESRIKDLGGSNYAFPAGGITKKITELLGWKAVSKIKAMIK